MGTTIWVDDATRRELRKIQRDLGLPSANATVQALMRRPARDARSLFAEHRDAIQEILNRHRLGDLVAFGSRARGEGRPGSDLDLAVRRLPGSSGLAILGAEAELVELLGMEVDLVERPNPRLEQAIAEGVPFG